MSKSAIWSLICYPLALVSCIIGGFLVNSQPHRSMGFVVLGFYMLLLQIIWSSLALREPGQKMPAGDIGFLATCALGSICVLALLFGSFSDVASNWLVLGGLLSIMISQVVGKFCEAVATHSLRPFYDDN
jgi:cell division protein FtsW (lipid II flippase)